MTANLLIFSEVVNTEVTYVIKDVASTAYYIIPQEKAEQSQFESVIQYLSQYPNANIFFLSMLIKKQLEQLMTNAGQTIPWKEHQTNAIGANVLIRCKTRLDTTPFVAKSYDDLRFLGEELAQAFIQEHKGFVKCPKCGDIIKTQELLCSVEDVETFVKTQITVIPEGITLTCPACFETAPKRKFRSVSE